MKAIKGRAFVQSHDRIASACFKTMSLWHRAQALNTNLKREDELKPVRKAIEDAVALVHDMKTIASNPDKPWDFVSLLARISDLRDLLDRLDGGKE